MLNKIWFGLLLFGILYSFGRGAFNTIWPPQQAAAIEVDDPTPQRHRDLQEMGKDLNAAALSAAEVSIEICIGLIGIMALWLGLLAVAREAGMVDALARMLSPLMCWLFPDVPDGHPAQGAMLMNISANMLNLDNAATPLGLKAMQELQTLNPDKETATNSMAMFMAINTSNVTLIPFTITCRWQYGPQPRVSPTATGTKAADRNAPCPGAPQARCPAQARTPRTDRPRPALPSRR